jgi:hypothetical protein
MPNPDTDSSVDIALDIDAARLCFGLSRIGYTPTTAICDILDNSIRAKAHNIRIEIIKEREELNDKRKNNIKEYIVLDDGIGMSDMEMKAALALGAPNSNYEPHSLSKFGLGLKSAAFSQGDELHLISSPGDTQFKKYVISLPEIALRKTYFARQTPLTQDDNNLISKYLSVGQGTIVRIAKVRNINQPSLKDTVEELTLKAGIIYYYFIKEDNISIFINEQPIPSYDVLFVDEANENGNLNEHEWEGKSVRWIQKQKEISLDVEAGVSAKIEVTQLPYPPIFELEKRGGQAEVRKKYNIDAGNYGFYVYRNKRLISWSQLFGIIPQDQDYYAFRGRILIDDSADDCFNIDVKKSSITLSEEARSSIDILSENYKFKSRKAWERASKLKKESEGEDSTTKSNTLAADFTPPQILPGEPVPTQTMEIEIGEREKEVKNEMRAKLRKVAIRQKSEAEGRVVTDAEINEVDIEKALKGDANPSATKVFKVEHVEDNALWEPYFDPDLGVCVRINKLHRYARQVYEENDKNSDLQVMFELFLLQMAEAEIHHRTHRNTQQTQAQIGKLIAEYRRMASEYLAAMCRQLEGKLPPSRD